GPGLHGLTAHLTGGVDILHATRGRGAGNTERLGGIARGLLQLIDGVRAVRIIRFDRDRKDDEIYTAAGGRIDETFYGGVALAAGNTVVDEHADRVPKSERNRARARSAHVLTARFF